MNALSTNPSLPTLTLRPVLPAGLTNLVLSVVVVPPIALLLKAVALAITQGVEAVTLDAVVRTFFDPYMLITIAMVPVCMLVECAVVGWKRSALRKLAVRPSQDARNDLFFFVFMLSGAPGAMITILGGGLVEAALGLLNVSTYHGPLEGAPVWVQVPLLYLAMNFANYWSHRAMHSRLLWPMHAIHHVTTDFTMVDMVRVSMVEIVITTFFLSASVSGLDGSSIEAITLAAFLFANDSLFLHSDLPGLLWLERLGFNPPRAHRVHHGLDARYHHRNFGSLLCVWDMLFGTYLSPRDAEPHQFAIGIADEGFRYESSLPLLPWLATQWQWLRGLPRSFVPGR